MTNFLASVMSAVKGPAALLLARDLGLATKHLVHLFSTKTVLFFWQTAWIALASVTSLFTLMQTTVQCLVANVFARVLASSCNLARDVSHLFAAVASH